MNTAVKIVIMDGVNEHLEIGKKYVKVYPYGCQRDIDLLDRIPRNLITFDAHAAPQDQQSALLVESEFWKKNCASLAKSLQH